MKLILTTLLASIAALSFTSCNTTQAGRGYQVNAVNSSADMSSAPGAWVVDRSRSGHTDLSYSNLIGYPVQY